MGVPDAPISRRSALLGGAAVLAGLGLAALPQPAGADAPDTPGDRRRGPFGLTPVQQAGQRVVWSYPGRTVPADLLDAIRAGLVGGVIFFGENIDRTDPSQIQGVTAQLAQAQRDSGLDIPLLLMTDQEGGIVRRLPGAPVASEKQIGQSADPTAAAADAGTGAGTNLLGAGMNTNLAPVLDVYREEGNFDDEFGRSYSSDPAVAAACGAAFVTAQQQLGVIATAKHFPGLGAATQAQNTDLGPVVLDVPLDELRAVDEYAFTSSIAAGVDMVMTSWAIYPALDAQLPAGLSPTIVQGELRQRLGFTGVTITDALEAGSLDSFGDTGQRAVLAAAAGMDVLLCSARDVAQGRQAVDALAAAVADRRLSRGTANAALQRVVALRRG